MGNDTVENEYSTGSGLHYEVVVKNGGLVKHLLTFALQYIIIVLHKEVKVNGTSNGEFSHG